MDGHRATYFPALFLWAAIILLLCPVVVFSADSSPKLSAEDREILRSFEERILRIKQRQEHQRRAATDSPPSIPAEEESNTEDASQRESPLPALPEMEEEPTEEIRTASADSILPSRPQEEDSLSAPVELSPSETTPIKPQIDDLQRRVAALESQLAVLESRSSQSGFGWLALGTSMAGWVLVLRRRPSKPKQHPPEEKIPESFEGGAMTDQPGRYAEFEEILPWPPSESGLDSSSGYLNQLVQSANQSFQKGDYLQADAVYRKLLELQPQNFAIHCGIAELNVLAERYEAGWEFTHFSLPRFHQPDRRSILIFLAIAAGRLSGRETLGLEKEFQQVMQEEFVVSWNLEDVQQWLFTSAIPEGIREGLVKEMDMLRSHQATRHQGKGMGIEVDSDLNTSPHLEKEKLCSG